MQTMLVSVVCVSTVSGTPEGDPRSTVVKITRLVVGASLKTTTLQHLNFFKNSLKNVRCLFIMKKKVYD